MDAVFDPIGGQNWNRSLQTLSKNGRFVGYGYTTILEEKNDQNWIRDWTSFIEKGKTEKGNTISLYSITELKRNHPDWFQKDAEFLLSLLKQRKINPLISHRIPLDKAGAAQALL
ncbi:zinc-binding dehydrogenase [Bacillus sp. M6-12]|uniref:zinc-binding dehydrogenase n=1 Tax=Bacillus sp. M6-12 TaxID=2054166 RepID=UPI002155ED0D|nr:zinc-binding dehydrogenase [Bacillus sp. M6-12]